ncbi:MAG: WD40 repeat domain-containing protein [Anaerolineaceae bacterium]
MQKPILALILATLLFSACSPSPTLPAATLTPKPLPTKTLLPPTATPTATPTPVPEGISAANFEKLEKVSSTSLDQTVFVGFLTDKIGFYENEANIPDGEVRSARFESYRWLENGDLAGMLVYFPLDCGLKQYGNKPKRSCSSNRYYYSMIDLTRRTTLWKQYLPINMAGPELNQLVDELEIKNFKPKPIFTNRGYTNNEWSNDGQFMVVPIQVVDSTLVKDVQSGENIFVYPWGSSVSWIGAISPDKKNFAFISGGPIGGMDALKIQNLESGKVENLGSVSGLATDLAWSKDGSKIAVGTQNGFVAVFDPGEKSTIILKERRFDLADQNPGGVERLKFSDDGSKIAFTEMMYLKDSEPAGRLAIYDLETKKEVNSFTADFYQEGEIIWDQGNTFVVTVTDFINGRIVLLSADKTVEVPLTSPGNVADYKPRIFTSLISFKADQTRLTLVRSLFNDATVDEYEVRP